MALTGTVYTHQKRDTNTFARTGNTYWNGLLFTSDTVTGTGLEVGTIFPSPIGPWTDAWFYFVGTGMATTDAATPKIATAFDEAGTGVIAFPCETLDTGNSWKSHMRMITAPPWAYYNGSADTVYAFQDDFFNDADEKHYIYGPFPSHLRVDVSTAVNADGYTFEVHAVMMRR